MPKFSNNELRQSLTSKTERWHFCSSLKAQRSQESLSFPLSSLPTQPQPKRKPTFIKIRAFRTAVRCPSGKRSSLLMCLMTVTSPVCLEAVGCKPLPSARGFPFPELRKNQFQNQFLWSGPSSPAATELNSSSSLCFHHVRAVLEMQMENHQLLLASNGFQKLHFRRAGQMGQNPVSI